MSKGKFYERKNRERRIENDIRSHVMRRPNGFAFYSGLFCRRTNNMLETSSWRGNIGGIDVAFPRSTRPRFFASVAEKRGRPGTFVTSACERRRCHVEECKALLLSPDGKPGGISADGSQNGSPGTRSHVSRDVQERVVVVLDRGFLVAVVVHFKRRESRRCTDGLAGLRWARAPVSLPELFIGYGRRDNSGPVGQTVPLDTARWRPLLENRWGSGRRDASGRLIVERENQEEMWLPVDKPLVIESLAKCHLSSQMRDVVSEHHQWNSRRIFLDVVTISCFATSSLYFKHLLSLIRWSYKSRQN